MSIFSVPTPATSSGASSFNAIAGTLRMVTPVTLPRSQAAVTSTGPAGMSSRNLVTGSTIGTMPVSSRTVTMHIVFEPDIGGYSVGSMTMAPATQSGRVGGTSRLTWRATEPRGSWISRRRTWS